jgi:DinB superfamily
MAEPAVVDRAAIRSGMEQARAEFHELVSAASATDLKRDSEGTRWTNHQLLFHMLFGYLVVRVLLGLVKMFGRLPDGASSVYSHVLDAATKPFHVINYVGSVGGARVLGPRRLDRKFDRVIDSLTRHLDAESEAALHQGMHFPPGWDPFFEDFMTLADLYRYPTRHFEFHRQQLTLPH